MQLSPFVRNIFVTISHGPFPLFPALGLPSFRIPRPDDDAVYATISPALHPLIVLPCPQNAWSGSLYTPGVVPRTVVPSSDPPLLRTRREIGTPQFVVESGFVDCYTFIRPVTIVELSSLSLDAYKQITTDGNNRIKILFM